MKRRGFTLLEMLVATAIMGIAVVTMLSGLSTSLRHAARLTDYDRAAILARAQMDALLLDRRLAAFEIREGRFDPRLTGGVESGWRARLSPFEVPPHRGPGQQILERMELEVWWMSGSDRRTLTLEAFRRQALRSEDMAALPPSAP